MKIKESKPGFVVLSAEDGMVLRRSESETNCVRSVIVSESGIGDWEEVPEADIKAAMETADKERAYAERVDVLIRERYTLSEELALLRQREVKPDEFSTYDAFAEACKAKAREEVGQDTMFND